MEPVFKVVSIASKGKDNQSYNIQNQQTLQYDQIKVPVNIEYKIGDIIDNNFVDSINKSKLYKDYQKINSRDKCIYQDNLKELSGFIEKSKIDPNFLKELLLWNKIENELQNPVHIICGKKQKSDGKEKTICRCMYHFNKDTERQECLTCKQKERWHNISPDVKILEYEYPTTKKYTNVGGIDLILEYNDQIYATEVKPKSSKETLARMIAEILTYTCDIELLKQEPFIKGRNILPAICFFKNSDQEKDFYTYKELLEPILKTITVFVINKKENPNGITDFSMEPLSISNPLQIN